jgi:DNA-binding LytR/AlgR family response regulator
MSVLKIGVVEDELVIGRTILNTLEELGYTHCGPAISYTEAMEMLDQNKPDLLLLDIQLSGKKDGIDVAEKINELYRLPFIFLTANSDGETIDRAKKVKPHAYIVKPFTKDELFAAIEIAFSNFTGNRPAEKAGLENAYPVKDHMFVKDGYVFRKIQFNELSHIESDANYLILHLSGQKKVMVRASLNEFSANLDPNTFIRVHRSYSVNIHQVDDISPTDVLVNGIKVPIGKSYRDDFLKALGISDT